MTDSPDNPPSIPVWARDDAFPSAPGGFGWTDAKGRRRVCGSLAELAEQVRDAAGGEVFLVWTPAFDRMRLPEEIDALAEPLETARHRGIREDLAATRRRVRWFGAVLGAAAAWQWMFGVLVAGQSGFTGPAERVMFGLRAVLGSTTLGLGLLGFLVFGFIPWYQARKRHAELLRRQPVDTAAWIPVLRFESWLAMQAAPVTWVLLGLVTAVWLTQWWCDGSALDARHSVAAAGLLKTGDAAERWWRLLTAPLLHGGVVHFLMNMAALTYLGKRLEVLARWPHLPLVFLFAAWIGGEASARFVTSPSVGASGGLMGWLGFLIVFETLHGRLVPRPARKRLVAGVLLTGLIGLLGYRFIDNAAHLGGLLAGIAYAAIVFPKSSSANRPGTTLTDRVAGAAALLVLLAAAVIAVLRIAAAHP